MFWTSSRLYPSPSSFQPSCPVTCPEVPCYNRRVTMLCSISVWLSQTSSVCDNMVPETTGVRETISLNRGQIFFSRLQSLNPFGVFFFSNLIITCRRRLRDKVSPQVCICSVYTEIRSKVATITADLCDHCLSKITSVPTGERTAACLQVCVRACVSLQTG